LGSHLGGDAGKILGSFSEGSKLPIVVTGTISKPKLSFKWPKPENIGSILQGILGSSGDSKPQTESPDTQQKTGVEEAGDEVEEVEKETQPVKREEEVDLEDTVKKLFKGLFK
jgi:hypothetical protein